MHACFDTSYVLFACIKLHTITSFRVVLTLFCWFVHVGVMKHRLWGVSGRTGHVRKTCFKSVCSLARVSRVILSIAHIAFGWQRCSDCSADTSCSSLRVHARRCKNKQISAILLDPSMHEEVTIQLPRELLSLFYSSPVGYVTLRVLALLLGTATRLLRLITNQFWFVYFLVNLLQLNSNEMFRCCILTFVSLRSVIVYVVTVILDSDWPVTAFWIMCVVYDDTVWMPYFIS